MAELLAQLASVCTCGVTRRTNQIEDLNTTVVFLKPLMVQFLVVNFSMHAKSDPSITLESVVWMGSGP